jgi:hypothetical protein
MKGKGKGKGGVDKPMTLTQFSKRLYQVYGAIARNYNDHRSYPVYIHTDGFDLDYDTFQVVSNGLVALNGPQEAQDNHDWMMGQMDAPDIRELYGTYLDVVTNAGDEN